MALQTTFNPCCPKQKPSEQTRKKKKRDKKRVQEIPVTITLGMRLVFKIDSRKYLNWGDILRLDDKIRNAKLRDNHR